MVKKKRFNVTMTLSRDKMKTKKKMINLKEYFKLILS